MEAKCLICGIHASSNLNYCDECMNKYPCDDCGIFKPETYKSPKCNDCIQEKKRKDQEFDEKYGEFLSHTPSMEDLKNTIEKFKESVLVNLSVEDVSEEIRISCIYQGILQFIKGCIYDHDFIELEQVLKSKNWDCNSFDDTQSRDIILDIIEEKLEETEYN